MSAQQPHVQTEVQRVWEILLDDGSVYTFNEEPTAAAALAKAEADRAASVEMMERFEAEYGPGESEKGADYYRSLRYAKVRQRTGVSVNVYTTEYGPEIAAEELDVQRSARTEERA
ncbi:hypothetical protein [Nocardia sp. NPDC057227]|uniref:hypothetical protein n=1 Tax=Nocardia sp. NPDC057227 TaxID=3346056 RepID=UPI00362ECEBA